MRVTGEAIADHSGDAYFDFVYRHDWPNTLNELAKHRDPKRKEGVYDALAEVRARKGLAVGLDDGRVRRFLDTVWKKEKLSLAEGHAIMNVCMAATYDPDPKAPLGFRLPFNLETGETIDARWRTWLKHDPIHLVGKYAHNLRKLAGIYLDCGWRDQYHIHYGMRILSQRLAEAGIRHTYEEYRRQPHRRRLPDGREPAVPLSRVEAVTRHRLGDPQAYARLRGSRVVYARLGRANECAGPGSGSRPPTCANAIPLPERNDPAGRAGTAQSSLRRRVGLERDAAHLARVLRLDRARHFVAPGRVDPTAAATAGVALEEAGSHFRMAPAQVLEALGQFEHRARTPQWWRCIALTAVARPDETSCGARSRCR